MLSSHTKNIIRGLEEGLIHYSKSLDEIRNYFTEFEQLELRLAEGNEENLKAFKIQLDFSGFLTISMTDLIIICKGTLQTNQKWEQLHYLKLGYLTVHEVINTYAKHSQQLKQSSANNEELKNQFASITNEIKIFKRDYDYPKSFTKVRNFTIGHIDTDFKSYFDILNGMDVEKSFSALLDFMQVLGKLNGLAAALSLTLKLRVNGIEYDIMQIRNIIDSSG